MALTVSSWSGWTEDYEPQEQEYVFEATPRLTIQVPDQHFPNFSVIDVSDTEIRIQSDIPLSQKGESGGIDLLSDQKEFTIPYGESITLTTRTMDAGMIYTFTYLPDDAT